MTVNHVYFNATTVEGERTVPSMREHPCYQCGEKLGTRKVAPHKIAREDEAAVVVHKTCLDAARADRRRVEAEKELAEKERERIETEERRENEQRRRGVHGVDYSDQQLQTVEGLAPVAEQIKKTMSALHNEADDEEAREHAWRFRRQMLRATDAMEQKQKAVARHIERISDIKYVGGAADALEWADAVYEAVALGDAGHQILRMYLAGCSYEEIREMIDRELQSKARYCGNQSTSTGSNMMSRYTVQAWAQMADRW